MIDPIEPVENMEVLPWAKRLTAYCRSLALKGDGRTCRVAHGPNGTTISVIAGEGSSPGGGGIGVASSYSGFFVIADASDAGVAKISVIDGTGVLANNCGIFVSGVDKVNVPTWEQVVAAPGFVIMDAVYNITEGSTSGTWEVSFRMSPAIPDFSPDCFSAVIGWVDYSDGVIGKVVQIWNNGIIYNNRYS